MVYGAVSPRIARVVLGLRGGGSVEATPVAPVAYAGAYHDALRFVIARVPAGRDVVLADLRDATGGGSTSLALSWRRHDSPRRGGCCASAA